MFVDFFFCFVFLEGGLLVCLWKNPAFFPRTGSNPVETSGDDSSCISDTHHMWFIILRLACPRQIGLVYFETVPYIYMGPGCDDTSARWKCFQCLCLSSKGLMGTSTGDVTQEAPWANPLHPHLRPTAPFTPPLQQCWGQLTHYMPIKALSASRRLWGSTGVQCTASGHGAEPEQVQKDFLS